MTSELVMALRELEWKAGNAVAAYEAMGRTANGLKAACENARTVLARVGDTGEGPSTTCWLIEEANKTAIYWWSGGPLSTTDAQQAIRFARREDAERVIQHLPDGHFFKAVEHVWF